MKKLLLSLFLGLQALMVLGQTDTSTTSQDWREKFFNSSELVLPRLFEAAIENSAANEVSELAQDMAAQQGKIIRKEIFTGINLGGTYSYGTNLMMLRFGEMAGQPFDPTMLGWNAFKLPAAAFYNTGLSVAFPIGQFLTRGHKIRMNELQYKQILAQNKGNEMEVRKMVIGLYQEIVLAKSELELSQEAFQSASMLYKLAERQLMDGEILISEMSAIQENYSRAAVAKEAAKIKYETSFLYMEELIGMRMTDLLNTL